MKINELRAKILEIKRSPFEDNGHSRDMHTWDQVRDALVPAHSRKRIHRALIWKIGMKDYDPHDLEIRLILGLDEESPVTYIDGRSRPRAVALDVAQCACGMFYISNHPRRQRCFVCSPYRGKR